MTPFRSYIERLDWEAIYSFGSLRSWVQFFSVWLFLIALGAWIPVTARHLALTPGPVLVMLGVMALAVAVQTLIHRRWGLSYGLIAWMSFASPLVELTMAMMVILSASVLGKVVYGLLLLLATLSHGWTFRVTWQQPYMAGSLSLLMPLAASADIRAENFILVGILTVGCVVLMFTVGTTSEIQARNQQRAAAERAAMAAQLLEQAHSEAAGWERQFTLLAGLHHDIGNLLTNAALRSGLMLRKLRSDRNSLGEQDVEEGFATINEALRTVSGLIAEAKKAHPSQSTERVDLVPVLKSIPNNLGTSPALSLSLELPASALVDVPGGEPTLKRLFDNLLRNAVEGNGQQPSRNIRVALVDTGASLAVSILDDGPGFPEHLLQGRAKGYFTTKRHGTGLGLVTAEALTAACRGTLRRSNRPEGGARVDVVLPRAKEDSKEVA